MTPYLARLFGFRAHKTKKGHRPSARLGFEVLEDRAVPAITVLSMDGNLTIRGDNTSNDVELDSAGVGMVSVTNNGVSIGTFSLTGNLNVSLGNDDDTFFFADPMTNFIVPGKMTVNLGGGRDSVGLAGTFVEGISVDAGPGDDFITLAQIVSSGALNVFNGGAGNDTVFDFPVGTKTFTGITSVQSASVFFSFPEPVFDTLIINNVGEVDPILSMNGTVLGNLTYSGGTTDDTVRLGGSVGGILSVSGGAGNNSLLFVDGTSFVGGNVNFYAGSGDDSVLVINPANINGSLNLILGEGNNSLDFIAPLTLGGNLLFSAGNGDNTFNASAGNFIAGDILVFWGNGTNTFIFQDGFELGGDLIVRGGTGANSITFASQTYAGLIRITLGGGASTVDFSAVTDFGGTATIDFGVGPGPKTFLEPGMVSGLITLVNYP